MRPLFGGGGVNYDFWGVLQEYELEVTYRCMGNLKEVAYFHFTEKPILAWVTHKM